MLFYGDEQISRAKLAEKFGLNISDIEKKPSFENKKRKVDNINGGRIKSGMGYGRRSHFYVKDPQTKLDVSIRYAKSRNINRDGQVVYEPRYVQFVGAVKSFQDDLDLATFFALCPENSLSPLRPGNATLSRVKPKFEYIDTKKRAKDKRENIGNMSKAIRHAEDASYQELIILAKGIGLTGIDFDEEDTLRSEMMDLAYRNPSFYMQKAETEVTIIEGRIVHLVDTGAIKMRTIGQARVWEWAAGNKDGQRITEVMNQTENAKKALIKFLMNNLQHNLADINNTVGDINAYQNAERVLKQVKESKKEDSELGQTIGDDLPDYLKEKNKLEMSEEEWKAYGNELRDLLSTWKTNGKQAAWTDVKAVKEALASGEIDKDQIRGFVKENFGY